MRYTRWANEDLDLLVELRLAGYTWAQIAEELDRTAVGCQRAARRHGLMTINSEIADTYNQHGHQP